MLGAIDQAEINAAEMRVGAWAMGDYLASRPPLQAPVERGSRANGGPNP